MRASLVGLYMLVFFVIILMELDSAYMFLVGYRNIFARNSICKNLFK